MKVFFIALQNDLPTETAKMPICIANMKLAVPSVEYFHPEVSELPTTKLAHSVDTQVPILHGTVEQSPGFSGLSEPFLSHQAKDVFTISVDA
jgi:hypothetical protein